ncbi:hypothetical protein AcV5_007198 [Taiwanofungus camphoratus]|nr:hypothetical protein AcV5_007198 [Antrodia cinnamomea]
MLDSGKQHQTFVKQVPVTRERPPYNPSSIQNNQLQNPGTARANIAPSVTTPDGTQTNNWASEHPHQTVLQQHCEFFDPDNDGVVWPLDTFRGFRDLGFNFLISVFAVLIIHSNFSYPTCPGLFPDPFFRVFLSNIHKAKHGSDMGVYDNEGRFVPQKFEDVFSKYGGGKHGLTKEDIWDALKGQRVLLDPIGWFGAFFEWLSLYLLLWPEDGIVRQEDVRRVYDGSIFPELASKRTGKMKAI